MKLKLNETARNWLKENGACSECFPWACQNGETLAERRRRWLVATCPEWREAVDCGTLSDAGVTAEVVDCLLRVLRAKLASVYDGSLETLRTSAPVIDDRERCDPVATPRELAKLAAMVRQRLNTIDGVALRTWEPEATHYAGQVARTVRVVLWCEAAATEVRARIILDRGES
jgi:hypothetical protein